MIGSYTKSANYVDNPFYRIKARPMRKEPARVRLLYKRASHSILGE